MKSNLAKVTATGALCVSLIAMSNSARAQKHDAPGWKADPKVLDALAQKNTKWIYRESDVPPYTLQDPLLCQDGTRVSTAQQWEQKRRPELLEMFREYVYGRAPGPGTVTFESTVTDTNALDGKATLKTIRITSTDGGKSFSFNAWLMVPKNAAGRVPAFLLINNRPVASADPARKTKDQFWPVEQIIARGYAAAVFQTVDVDPDKDGPAARVQGVRGVFAGPGKEGEDAWATLSAWAWGASRVMDYLQTDPAIDGGKVAIIGHSRGGKTSLWAGAQDPRFALVISNDSGCGGAALSRRVFGETVALINHGFPYWFCGNFHKFDDRENQLPVDQHELLALIAPRALYVASADEDMWADQRGEFLSLAHASPVFAPYGQPEVKPDEMPALARPLIRGNVAYHIRRGAHGLTLYDWERYMDFADRRWRGKQRE